MHVSLTRGELAGYVSAQLLACFPDRDVAADDLAGPLDLALERLDLCFGRLDSKVFSKGTEPAFNHLHSDQYAMLLYFLSNSVYRLEGSTDVAAKIYALNKALHGLDVFYEVDLPDVFAFQHPVGTVLGRATYSDYFFVYQRCSVGSSVDGEYPVMGEGVVMFGGSAIIGKATVGDNVWLSVGTTVIDDDLPSDSIAFGRSPDLTIKSAKRSVVDHFFAKP